ncbi:DUF4145 domain-containing protein [Herbaspirillum sp. VT-16-41]|uniref:DUF4145 domain-containing protein n=1 Tax=Herbaspirillum sp. VT-16-41 TaxID=1953765 RepID=UPI000980C82D|nr:DUF4145 domain-containing protein [Herbaspirillum sp. VT-16-41]
MSPSDWKGNLGDTNRIDVAIVGNAVFPVRKKSIAPDSVPEAAAKAFIQGSDSLKDGRYTAAVAMFRRTIDVGTKQFNTDIEVFRLEKRIDKLAEEGKITKDLQTWAHKIRFEGNGAIHELDEPTKEQTEELELFTELVLTYLFTLPAKVRANLPTTE